MELDKEELNFLVNFFSHWANPFRAFDKYEIHRRGWPFGGPYEIDLTTLIKKKIVSESPDGNQIKLTDLGYELMISHIKNKKRWSQERVIKVELPDKNEVLIQQGNYYGGFKMIRDIFQSAQFTLWIQDPYVGPDLFSIIYELNQIEIRVLLGTRSYNERESVTLAYKKIKKERGKIEMRVSSEIHNRYIFVDQKRVYQLGGSIKDIGNKEDVIKTIRNPDSVVKGFGKIWDGAKKI